MPIDHPFIDPENDDPWASEVAAVFWVTGELLGGALMLVPSTDGVIAACVPGYDVLMPSHARHQARLAFALQTAEEVQAEFINDQEAEKGDWLLANQPEHIRRMLAASKGGPPPGFHFIWPSNQPRLALMHSQLHASQIPTGNVWLIDASSSRTLADSLQVAALIQWGALQ
ncbi:hypothetical protein [Cryobacterium sp. Y11]|uniref:hypothetical protein n=1 Tax=Cryobacterium sp. Y11 TaxID=2045016 RepID=UPI000CE48ED5|nr:hypothetical protein [Cryobacterium sp. Y11]